MSETTVRKAPATWPDLVVGKTIHQIEFSGYDVRITLGDGSVLEATPAGVVRSWLWMYLNGEALSPTFEKYPDPVVERTDEG